MAKREQQHGFEVWTIESPDGASRASFVPELGGIGSSLVLPSPAGPRELLFQHAFFWNKRENHLRGGWPFLFPICGRVELDGKANTYRIGADTFFMPIHGVAPYVGWRAAEGTTANDLRLELQDSEVTRVKYPFAFSVTLWYVIENDRLTCTMSCRNLSDRPMPWYAGFHPYFRVPDHGAGKENVMVHMEADRLMRYNERKTDVVGEAAPPVFPLSIEEARVNEMLIRLGAEKEIRLSWPDGFTIHLKAKGAEDSSLFPYAQMYTQPDQPFFCVEPWMGAPNSLNDPGRVHWLKPGQVEHGRLTVWTSWK